jgi:hypothetical protein
LIILLHNNIFLFTMRLFEWFEDSLDLSIGDSDVSFVFHFLFLDRINEDLEEFRSGWNDHALRTERNNTPTQLLKRYIKKTAALPNPEMEDNDSDDNDYGLHPRRNIQALIHPISRNQLKYFKTQIIPLRMRDDDVFYMRTAVRNALQCYAYTIENYA